MRFFTITPVALIAAVIALIVLLAGPTAAAASSGDVAREGARETATAPATATPQTLRGGYESAISALQQQRRRMKKGKKDEEENDEVEKERVEKKVKEKNEGQKGDGGAGAAAAQTAVVATSRVVGVVSSNGLPACGSVPSVAKGVYYGQVGNTVRQSYDADYLCDSDSCCADGCCYPLPGQGYLDAIGVFVPTAGCCSSVTRACLGY